VLPGGQEMADQWRRLLEAIACCGLDSEAVIASEVDPAEAILEQARARQADIIVVGSRPRLRSTAPYAEGVAAQVVERATRSVLVTAFGDARPARAP
ncbi:MAG TPA: universal stress protein, partial [Polyangiaceae bacterium]|nr:universal stress protein [Polyangiaceae bacterium]